MKRDAIATLVLAILATLPLNGYSKDTSAQRKKDVVASHVEPVAVQKAAKGFRPAAIRAHVKYLSDDLLEGRGPGTRGDQLAAKYIAANFEAAGLQPAGDQGTYFQNVPLIGIRTDGEKTRVVFRKGALEASPRLAEEMVLADEMQRTESSFEADVVFVGHGVVAPEYKWDDYKGTDVRGKVILMLVDDPPATESEPDLFGGRARTYYGRWTYKYETALAKGAIGAILIHTDQSAGYGWSVVRNSWSGQRSFVKVPEGGRALSMTSWMIDSFAKKVFDMAGLDLARTTEEAHSRKFTPVTLAGVKIESKIVAEVTPFNTYNVIGRLEGSDPVLSKQAVLYTAHYDHLGIGNPENGDAIYNGAMDNASGVGTLLELARVWSETRPRPKRSIYFAAVGAEEQGLRGSEFYAAHPVVPPGLTAVNLNFDEVDPYGRTKNVTMLGIERTTFYPIAQKVTRAMGLRIDPDPRPEQGSYYRSDHFSLAKTGIPSFSIDPGGEIAGKPKAWGTDLFAEYKKERYHQPDDEYRESWDFSGHVQMAHFGFWLGWEAANMSKLPTWLPGDEFLAAREKSFGK